MKHAEILFWKIAIRILDRGYGRFCYFSKEEDRSEDCVACQAEDTIKFIEYHIKLLKMP